MNGMTLDELLTVVKVPGRTLRLTWHVDARAGGAGWVVASWDDRGFGHLDFHEVVAPELDEALQGLAMKLGLLRPTVAA